jgi:hypothetical protein
MQSAAGYFHDGIAGMADSMKGNGGEVKADASKKWGYLPRGRDPQVAMCRGRDHVPRCGITELRSPSHSEFVPCAVFAVLPELVEGRGLELRIPPRQFRAPFLQTLRASDP